MRAVLCITAAALLLAGCQTLSYYRQAVAGQFNILSQREDIQALLEDPATPSRLRSKLATILEIRDFAREELALPVEDNFSTYVDLDRDYVVWNVFAAPEFSLEPVRWCYPVAGCVSYRGYFNEAEARAFAASLAERGYDVYVGGVAAYSTLGWFADPVLSTVVARADHELAGLIFHELAHQKVYVAGDTRFNEGFASTVEEEGVRRWLARMEGDEAAGEHVLDRMRVDRLRRRQFVSLVQEHVDRLEALYASGAAVPAMRREKQAILAELKRAYADLRRRWGGDGRYDAWFDRELNNAQLSTVSTYFSWVPAFRALLAEGGGELEAFYRRVAALGRRDAAERETLLAEKMPANQ